jgi:hypothetical protein
LANRLPRCESGLADRILKSGVETGDEIYDRIADIFTKGPHHCGPFFVLEHAAESSDQPELRKAA